MRRGEERRGERRSMSCCHGFPSSIFRSKSGERRGEREKRGEWVTIDCRVVKGKWPDCLILLVGEVRGGEANVWIREFEDFSLKCFQTIE